MEVVMSKPVVALITATFVCGSASAFLWQELRTEREQTRTLQARVAQLEQASSSALAPAPKLREPAPPAAEAIAEPPTQTSASPPKPMATVGAVGGWSPFGMVASSGGTRMDPEMQRRMQENFEQQQRLLKDPEYRDLMRNQQKMGMKRMYGDMEIMLDMSKEEVDRVLDVLAEQQVRSMEQQRPFLAPSDGSPPDEAAIREHHHALQEIQRKNEAELSAAMGSKYRDWQEYQQTMGARHQVMRLRETLAGSAEPIRQDQIKPLVQAMAREQQLPQQAPAIRRSIPGSQVSTEDTLRMQEEWLERTTQTHQRVRDSVSSLLTPSQMEHLQEQQDQERKMLEINIRTMRARVAEAQARGETANGQTNMLGVSNGLVIH
jgi:hypothetical protein